MSLTQIIGKVFVPRQRALEKHLNGGEALQRAVLEQYGVSYLASRFFTTEPPVKP